MSMLDWTHITGPNVQAQLSAALKALEPGVAASGNKIDDAILKGTEYLVNNPLFVIPLTAFINTCKAWLMTTGLGATQEEMQGAEFLAAFEQECHRLRDEAA